MSDPPASAFLRVDLLKRRRQALDVDGLGQVHEESRLQAQVVIAGLSIARDGNQLGRVDQVGAQALGDLA
jgi:hypothetical protein